MKHFFSFLFIKEKRDEFLERLGLYLLYAFILSIAANPFIMLFIGLDKFQTITIEDTAGRTTYFSTLTPTQQELISKYRIVDKEYIKRQQEWANQIEWIITTALLGWVSTSPRFQRGWPKIINKIKNNEPLI